MTATTTHAVGQQLEHPTGAVWEIAAEAPGGFTIRCVSLPEAHHPGDYVGREMYAHSSYLDNGEWSIR